MLRTDTPRHSRQAPPARVFVILFSLGMIWLAEQRLWAMDARMPEVSSGPQAHPAADHTAPVIWADEYPPPPDQQLAVPPAEATPQPLPDREDRALSPPQELIGRVIPAGPPGRRRS